MNKELDSVLEFFSIDGINFLQKGGYTAKENEAIYLEKERTSPLIQTTIQPTTETKIQRSPILEIISWIVGILAGLGAIYELILRHFFHTQSLF